MDNEMKTASNSKTTLACYVAHCPAHDWEGQQRETAADAQADLEGHRGWYPDEPHSGSGVRQC